MRIKSINDGTVSRNFLLYLHIDNNEPYSQLAYWPRNSWHGGQQAFIHVVFQLRPYNENEEMTSMSVFWPQFSCDVANKQSVNMAHSKIIFLMN